MGVRSYFDPKIKENGIKLNISNGEDQILKQYLGIQKLPDYT